MKIKFIALSLCVLLLGANQAMAQESQEKQNKHEIRLMASDGITQGLIGTMAGGISDAFMGSKRSNQSYSLVYGFGYRYAIERFRLGADVAFCYSKADLKLLGDKDVSFKERDQQLFVLPTAEFTYFKRGLVELYGGASAGVSINRHSEKAQSEEGKKALNKAKQTTSFAYQVNPIAVRLGNERVGGFLELGFGHKGFLTAGLNIRF